AALLIVMGSLVFISALLIAFLSSVATDRQSAHYHASGSTARLLANSTVDIVMGQIRDGTKGVDAAGKTLAWASQPGMIRTYNVRGQADGYYKLYSWAGMAGSGPFDPSKASETPPADWFDRPALYTDLNEPVSGVYPVVDPAATNSVQGFAITNAPVARQSPLKNAAPMPVQWLYVLQDGTLASATAAGAGDAVQVAGASTANPIVGRIAFWTDDDTCKININTAAGDAWYDTATAPVPGAVGNPGSFWDTPRIGSQFERTYLASNQPVRNEFQRYPGHPATTYLSAVFTNLTRAQLYALVPRVNGGGSAGGTVSINANQNKPIVQKTDRLYATVGELLAATNRSVNVPLSNTAVRSASFFLTAGSRSPEVNLFNEPRIAVWPVQATNTPACRTPYDSLVAFCSTLNSNAFYFQRANSMSPTNDLPPTPSPTGLGRNRALLSYLQTLTGQPVPGFSQADESFLTKYPQDRDQILTEIFDYVRTLNLQDVSSPTMTNSFTPTSKTPVNFNQVPPQSGQVTPIYDSVLRTRGFGRFPTVTEAALLFYGVCQTTATSTNSPPLSSAATAWGPAQDFTQWIPFSSNFGTTNAPTGMTRVQAILLLNLHEPAQGYSSIMHNFFQRVTWQSAFNWSDAASTSTYGMGFPTSATNHVFLDTTQTGGNLGPGADASSNNNGVETAVQNNVDKWRTGSGNPTGIAAFPYYSKTLDLPTGGSFTCSGGTIAVELWAPKSNANYQSSLSQADQAGPVQTLTITFPPFTAPVPGLAPLVTYANASGSTTLDYRDLGQRLGRLDGAGLGRSWVTPQDVVRSMVLDATAADARTVAATTNVPSSYFTPGPNYYAPAEMRGHGLYDSGSGPLLGAAIGKLVPGVTYATNSALTGAVVSTNGVTLTGTSATYQPVAANTSVNGIRVTTSAPAVYVASSGGATGAPGVFAGGKGTVPGDWDTGIAATTDGAYINKADEGDIFMTGTPYFSGVSQNTYLVTSNFFSPNRQMPSAGMFGSLPTGVLAKRPWQTLLFRPDPTGDAQHPGAQTPPDHLLLDLFTMPVVEPYAISDVFSTAGKVNMNYQIVPFTYLVRSTGVQAVLRSEQILAIPTSDGATYKGTTAANRRYPIDIAETLKGFAQRFASGDLFRSASEICTLWLVPAIANGGLTYSTMKDFWLRTTGSNNGALTGDNARERPYANLYPRLTTKSNTYTVHYRVQMLKKAVSTDPGGWTEGKDTVSGEYRGSSIIERYLDTSDTTLPDYATAAKPKPIDAYYKFRVLESREFRP
ncbi:MAG TPA: Verru_Chthon cassette protein A, partial [Candidatus Methylacidiphilales bacterium]